MREKASAETNAGYTMPYTPTGKASLVEHPPWHFASDVIEIVYRTNPEDVRRILPPPLMPGDQPDLVTARVTEITSVSENNPDKAYRNPDATQYAEAIITVTCRFNGENGVFIPFIWVDKDFSLMRGWLNGWPKKIATIKMTHLHQLHPILKGLEKGGKIGGVVTRHGNKIMFAGMEIEEESSPEEVPRLGTYFGVRHLPSVDPASGPSLHEVVKVQTKNYRMSDVWKGRGELEFPENDEEDMNFLAPKKIEGAFYFKSGWTNYGGTTLKRFNE